MATTIITKYGSGAPTASDVVRGELAVDTENGRLYTEDSGGSVVEIGLNPSGNVDVTGTVTADGLTVDTDTLVVDAANDRVGIGTASPDNLLHLHGSPIIRMTTATTGETATDGLIFGSNADGSSFLWTYENEHLYFGTNNTERVRITEAGNVGIGTSSPSTILTVAGTGDAETGVTATHSRSGVGYTLLLNNTNNGANKGSGIKWQGGGFDTAAIIGRSDATAASADAPGYLTFHTSTDGSEDLAERMRIDSSGNVGIGVVPESGWASNQTALQVGDLGADWQWGTGAGASRHITRNMYHDGTNFKYLVSTEEAEMYTQAAGNHHWYSNPNGTADATFTPSEKMRLDASGNLLVGKTANDNTTNGFVLDGNGTLNIVRSSEYLMRLNRTSTAGEIARFQKDGTTVGSISAGALSGGINPMAIGHSTAGIWFIPAANAIAPFDMSTNSAADNALDWGYASIRWDDIYATNGTIQTSDRNEKQDIEALSDAEQRVAVAAKGLLRKFRWKSSVEENGDDARIHFGIIAQDLQAAFEAEGLDAGRYAMFINSTWTDEETGEERSRMGVRYSELLAFIIAAI